MSYRLTAPSSAAPLMGFGVDDQMQADMTAACERSKQSGRLERLSQSYELPPDVDEPGGTVRAMYYDPNSDECATDTVIRAICAEPGVAAQYGEVCDQARALVGQEGRFPRWVAPVAIGVGALVLLGVALS